MKQRHSSADATQQAIDDFKRRMEKVTQTHQEALHSTIQQALERDLEALHGPPNSPLKSLRRSSQQFVGNVSKLVRKGIPFSRGHQEPTMAQANDATELDDVIDAEFTVLDPEESTQQTETKGNHQYRNSRCGWWMNVR